MSSKFTDHYYTSADDLRLHYRDYKPKTDPKATYLCMPGLTRNANDFINIAEYLQQNGCRVICIELRGRGDSQWDTNPENYEPTTYVADMFNLVTNELQSPKNLIAIGTSLGGLLAIMMQAMQPNTFTGIVINDMGMEISEAGIRRIKAYVGKDQGIQTWDDAIASVKSSNAAVYPNNTDADWDHFTRLLYVERDGVPVANYDPTISQNLNADTDSAAPTLWPLMDSIRSVPLVLLRGALSDILSQEIANKMQAEHGQLNLIVVPDVGHCPTFDTEAEKKAILTLA